MKMTISKQLLYHMKGIDNELIMKILTVPHKMLYRQATTVKAINAEIQGIIDRMFITMYRHKGIGLAANQVGIPLQIVVINIKWLATVLINPVVHDMRDGQVTCDESCLSIPGYSVAVERARYIKVKSMDRHGKLQNFEASGLLARVVQHECDHLYGILINST